ncbi:hypothetical protein [Stenotrophomonas sp.]|uniref:hypothetical protein n=1 Tax=Stenotrophomonas sp. TaxID=69392 RepID=UPI00289D8BDE|nr:hypothetical protein [Stenotrophomonas sp.]
MKLKRIFGEEMAVGANLKESIKHVLKISMIMSGTFFAVQPGMADTSNLPTVDAVPPIEYEPPEQPDLGGYDPGGGGGGGTPGSDQTQTCALLIATRPAACPNPIPLPTNPLYGDDRVPAGQKSSMRMAHNFVNGKAYWEGTPIQMDSNAIWFLQSALQDQVDAFAKGASLVDTNARMRIHLGLTCDMQISASSKYRVGGALTKPEQYCIQMLKAFDAEANDNQNFVYWFIEHQRTIGVPLENYVPYGLVSLVDTRNSIGEKWRSVTEDAACSKWWTQVQTNTCGVQ